MRERNNFYQEEGRSVEVAKAGKLVEVVEVRLRKRVVVYNKSKDRTAVKADNSKLVDYMGNNYKRKRTKKKKKLIAICKNI